MSNVLQFLLVIFIIFIPAIVYYCLEYFDNKKNKI